MYLNRRGATDECGVDFVLDLRHDDMRRVMALLGAWSLAHLAIELLDEQGSFER